jgi:hypothetical protein
LSIGTPHLSTRPEASAAQPIFDNFCKQNYSTKRAECGNRASAAPEDRQIFADRHPTGTYVPVIPQRGNYLPIHRHVTHVTRQEF